MSAELLSSIKEDVKVIQTDVKAILQLTAVHNELLRQHESRSLALQSAQEKQDVEISHIKKHTDFVGLALKSGGAILIGLIIQYITRKYI